MKKHMKVILKCFAVKKQDTKNYPLLVSWTLVMSSNPSGSDTSAVQLIAFDKGKLGEWADGSLHPPAHQDGWPGGTSTHTHNIDGGGSLILRQVCQDVVDEVAEALIDERDSRTRTDMVELVIVALLKVLYSLFCPFLSSISAGPATKWPVLPGGDLWTTVAGSSGPKMQVGSDLPLLFIEMPTHVLSG